MDEKEEKWLQEIRDSFVEDMVDEETVLEYAEGQKRHAMEFEKKSREKGAHWPENLIGDAFRLRSVELKDTDGGESLGETLSRLLGTLSERKEAVIQKFYKEEKSLEEIGNEFCVFYPEIYSILWQALVNLRYPSRAKRIVPYIVKSEEEPDPYGFNGGEEN